MILDPQPVTDLMTELHDMIAVCRNEAELAYLSAIDSHLREAIRLLSEKTFDSYVPYTDGTLGYVDKDGTIRDAVVEELITR